MKNVRILGPNEPIPEGAVRIHLYRSENVLRPRGSMEKESLGLALMEAIRSAMESWTDPKYGDSLPKEQALELIERNAREEFETAIRLSKKLFL